jgi:hypothetical protein
MKLYVSVNENGSFKLWDRIDQCPADEVMVPLELTMQQRGKFGVAIMDAKDKAEKVRRLKETEKPA